MAADDNITTNSLLVSFGGHTLKVDSDHPRIADAIRTHLHHCPVDADAMQADLVANFNVTASSETTFTVSTDGSDLFNNLGYDLALQLLMTELISRLVAACERGLTFHAAALAYQGRGIILSGTSGSGKSSLAAWLTADGFQYLTDEVVEFLPEENQICGLTRSIFLKHGSAFIWQNRLPQTDSPRLLRFADNAVWIDPQLFHADAPISIATPRLLIFPHYIADAPLQAERLTKAEALFRLLQNLVNARNLPNHGMDATVRLASQVTAYTVNYSSLESASEWIQQTITAE